MPSVNRSHGRLLSLFAASALLLAACGGGGSDNAAKVHSPPKPIDKGRVTTTSTVPAYVSYVATAKSSVSKVNIYSNPTDAAPSKTLDNPWQIDPDYPDAKIAQVFLVKSQQSGWAQVLLPVRPNGSTGWVKTSDVDIRQNTYQIKVELGAHRITVTSSGLILYAGPIAVGTSDTPTPTGSYYLRVLIKAVDPTTVYGPYAYGLSSHSDKLNTFNGGDAEIGIHGNNDASVLGRNVTHGCIRMDNDAITRLTKSLPLGTPVEIVD
jgi:lipoprotein-anchoring transpeptidase ErfK/SrfK